MDFSRDSLNQKFPDRQFSLSAKRGTVKIGKGHELALIAGPCVVENEEMAHEDCEAARRCSR